MKSYVILAILVLVCSCKTIQTLAEQPIQDISVKKFVEKVNQPLDYKNLKIRAKTEVNIPGKSIPAIGLVMYNQPNQKIWINGSVSLLNVLRGLATPQQFKAYEKLNKTYIEENYEYVNQLLGVNFIDYSSLENLLIGKTFVPINSEDFVLEGTDTQYVLKSFEPIKVMYKNKEYQYTQSLTYDSNFNLTKVKIVEPQNNKSITVEYTERGIFNNINLPQKVKIFIKDTKNKEITLEYTSFEFEKMETHYRVPDNYDKRTF